MRRPAKALLVDQVVLEVGDLGREAARRVALGVEVELAHDQRHHPLAVRGVVDREGRLQADAAGLAAQDPHAGGVEGGHPHPVGARPDQADDPLAHLAGRLVGEGDGQHLARPHPPGRQQVGDPVGQDPGLARAGAGDDQQRAALVHDGLALLGVEPLEQRRGVALGGRRRRRRASRALSISVELRKSGPGSGRSGRSSKRVLISRPAYVPSTTPWRPSVTTLPAWRPRFRMLRSSGPSSSSRTPTTSTSGPAARSRPGSTPASR